MIYFCSDQLNINSSYKFNQSKINNYVIENDSIVISENTSVSGNSMQVFAFDFNGKQFFTDKLPIKINDLSMSPDVLYAVGDEQLYAYKFGKDNNFNKYIFSTNSNFKTVLSDSENRFILANSKRVSRGSIDSNSNNSKDEKTK